MSERGGNARRGGRGGSNVPARGPQERPKKESILNLGKYVDQRVRVKFSGGREMIGTLKGYDQLMNLVMDDVEELMHDATTGHTTGKTRTLGLTVLRGPAITLLSPADGMEEIANPFALQE